jgi:hypothetical protein
MLASFVNQISNLDDDRLRQWIIDGLTAYHDPNSKGYLRSENAFGRGGSHQRAVNDLGELFQQFNNKQQDRLSAAVAEAIDLISLTSTSRREALRDLIELSLNTKNSLAIDAINSKLLIPDAEVQRLICLDAVDFLREGHAVPALLDLARFMLQKIDFPFEIAGQLLVALCRFDLERAADYAEAIEPKLVRQLTTLRTYPAQFSQLKDDFAQAVLLAPNESPLLQQLLLSSVYSDLLDGKIVEIEQPAKIDPSDWSLVYVGPALALAGTVRNWGVNITQTCARGKRSICNPRGGLKSEDTLALLAGVQMEN